MCKDQQNPQTSPKSPLSNCGEGYVEDPHSLRTGSNCQRLLHSLYKLCHKINVACNYAEVYRHCATLTVPRVIFFGPKALMHSWGTSPLVFFNLTMPFGTFGQRSVQPAIDLSASHFSSRQYGSSLTRPILSASLAFAPSSERLQQRWQHTTVCMYDFAQL